MNHIYRRIWNAARQCWVVASELGKPRGKQASSSNASARRLSALVLALMGTGTAAAAEPIFWNKCDSYLNFYYCIPATGSDDVFKAANATLSSKRALVMGNGAYLDGSEAAIFGNQASSYGNRTSAFGYKARNLQEDSSAIGSSAYTDGQGATALGTVAAVNGGQGVAVGYNAYVDTGGGVGGIAIGGQAYAGTSGYTGAIALGGSSRAQFDGVSVGYNARTNAVGTVALGTHSVAGEANTVSVGNSDKQRRIVNVEEGRLTATSTDAVTGKQLHATNLKIGDLSGMMTKGTHADSYVLGTGSVSASANSVSVGSAGKKRRIQNIADGTLVAGSTDAVTGSQLHATNNRVTAVTTTANAAAARLNAAAPAIGQSATAEGSGTTASAAMGQSAKAYGSSSVAFGADARAMVDANGDKATGSGAVSIGANSRSGNGAVATGLRATAIGDRAIAVGNDASAAEKHATAMGYKANASAVGATALGHEAEASHAGSVALGKGSQTTAANQISVGSDSVKRKIVNVAEGVLSATSSEAVTGKQLNDTNVNVAAAQSEAQSAKTTADAAKVDAGKALAETALLGGLVSQVAATGDVRLGGKNSGTVLDVRNGANAGRKITGVADGVLSTTSTEAVTGKQLNQTNVNVAAAQADAAAANMVANEAKVEAGKALAETVTLGGLVSQVAATGDVRLGGNNSGAVLDVRNSMSADRRIIGVEDGVLSSNSNDGVNGAQLYQTNIAVQVAQDEAESASRRLDEVEGQARFMAFGTPIDDERAQAGRLGVALGDSAEASLSSEGGVAIGSYAKALGTNSVAIGRASGVADGADAGFALGSRSRVEEINGVAVGASSQVRSGAIDSVALGNGSIAGESLTVSVGGGVLKRRLVNVDRGTADHNATTVAQLKDSLATLGGGAGMDASGNVVSPTYALQGGVQNTVGDALTVLDGAVVTTGSRVNKMEGQLRSVFQDSASVRADGISQVSLSGANGMVMTNLADGRVAAGSRDAVTGNQLYAAEQKISQNRSDLEAMRQETEAQQRSLLGLSGNAPIDFGGTRLTGVGDGEIGAASTDVVSGRQLNATNLALAGAQSEVDDAVRRVVSIEEKSRYMAFGAPVDGQTAIAGRLGIALGDSAESSLTSDGAVAVGSYSRAMGENSVALGRAAWVDASAESGFALGARSAVEEQEGLALGAASVVKKGAIGSIAIGSRSVAAEGGTASFGDANFQRRLVNIAKGTSDHNATTVAQLKDSLATLGGGAGIDANGNIVGPNFTVQGGNQTTLTGALEALDGAVVTTTSRVANVETQLRSVFQDTPSTRSDGVTQLSLAGANGMVISNVANGLIAAGSRDAVNGGQLHSMQQQLNGRMDGLEERVDGQPQVRAMASTPPAPQADEPSAVPDTGGEPVVASVGEGDTPAPQPKSKKDDTPTPTPQVDTAELEKMLARANEYTDGAISNVERRLDKMDKRFNRMAAMSSAQTAMAMNTAGLATYNRLGAGVGYAEGESAMAVGYQRVLNDKGSATFSLNGAFTNSGERSMGVGVGIGW